MPKFLRNVSSSLLSLCHNELRQFWMQQRFNQCSQDVTNEVVSVNALQHFDTRHTVKSSQYISLFSKA